MAVVMDINEAKIEFRCGKYKGRRVAYVVDHTYGGELCVKFGRYMYRKTFLE